MSEPWQPLGARDVRHTYLALHAHKFSAHWLWVAIERIAAGESETQVMCDFGYERTTR